MKKKIIFRGLIGAPIGIMIVTFILIFISISQKDGVFYAITPELLNVSKNELSAVIFQTVCVLIYGSIWGMASIIWDMEEWSILKQTLTHLIVVSISTFFVAYNLYWMPHSILPIISYFIIFFIIYLIIWIIKYLSIRKKIIQINEKIVEENIVTK